MPFNENIFCRMSSQNTFAFDFGPNARDLLGRSLLTYVYAVFFTRLSDCWLDGVCALLSLSSGQREELSAVLREYREVMSDQPGRSKFDKHKIISPGAKQTRPHMYRVSMALRAEVERQMHELLM